MHLQQQSPNLCTILSNELLLLEISPLLSVSALLSLAATSRFFTNLIYNTPGVFRYLNLSTTHGGAPRSEVKALYETDYRGWNAGELPPRDHYSQDLRNIFSYLSRKGVLQDITTLVLDKLNLPSVVFSDLLCTDDFNIRLLSVRKVNLLSEDVVMRVIRYLIRPSRPKGCPKLKGLYIFGAPLCSATEWNEPALGIGITTIAGAQLGTRQFHSTVSAAQASRNPDLIDRWYHERGPLLDPLQIGQDWADLIQACAGIIAFDAVLCRRCLKSSIRPRIASISLDGCSECDSAPEGPAYPGVSPIDYLPLASPPPSHRSSVKAAQLPVTESHVTPQLIARCQYCLTNRWCQVCHVWWCESCYPGAADSESLSDDIGGDRSIKVHDGMCVENCLVGELYSGGGEGGMWG